MVGTVLEIRHQDVGIDPALTVLCAGYEMGQWRDAQLVEDMFDRHLISFALSYTEFIAVDGATAARALKRAARAVYNTDKYKRRGEFGELILHAAVIDFFNAEPAVSKIFYKDSANDTVKGFDSVHVVQAPDSIEIWLGEAKFYQDIGGAITAAATSIKEHLERDFLRSEFIAITNKLDASWPHADAFRESLDEATSLDQIAARLVFPVLLTYDSNAVNDSSSLTPKYVADLVAEAEAAWDKFSTNLTGLTLPITLQLILVPVKSKKELVQMMHERLRAWQQV